MSRLSHAIAGGAVVALLVPATAAAAPDLRIAARHAPQPLLRGEDPNTTVHAGTLVVRVRNAGTDATDGSAVTVTDALPAGLAPLVDNPGFGAGPVAASGRGWTCTGGATGTCTREDSLPPGAAYAPIRVTVSVGNDAAARLTNSATVSGGGDPAPDAASDALRVRRDACPNGWSTEENVAFGPPVPAVDSGVRNVGRANGCSLLDVIWRGEPFRNHGRFVARVVRATDGFVARGLLRRREQARILHAADASGVGGPHDHQVDNSCPNRLAMSFDDGPSYYRSQTLRAFRANQAHAVFFDLGMRAEANPQLERFERSEGHVLLSHTYNHTDMNALSDAAKVEEVEHNEAVFERIGAPFAFHGIRTPFGSANAHTQEVVSSLGYTYFLDRVETGADYDPATTAAQTRDSILGQLRPGALIGLHDGPVDTSAGAATVAAVRQILPAAREMGYCWGKVDRTGQVVADRAISSGRPIPRVEHPVPYNDLEFPGTPPWLWFVAPDPIAISATHEPGTVVRGGTVTLTVAVTNASDAPSDPDPVGGTTVTVEDELPAGLTATTAAGAGWACSAEDGVRCTRSDTLGPHDAYPPITIAANVAGDAPATLTNAPTVTTHGQGWKDEAADAITVRDALQP